MAYGTASTFTLVDDYRITGQTEVEQQFVQAFGPASRNAFMLLDPSSNTLGDYMKEYYWQILSTTVERRDTTSVSAQTAQNLDNVEHVGPKISRRVPLTGTTVDSLLKQGFDANTMSMVIGQQEERGRLKDYLNTGLLACRASILSQSTAYKDRSNETIKYQYLNEALRLFGDAADSIVCWFMHSSVFADLEKEAITMGLPGVSNLMIMNGTPGSLNRPVIVTDSTSLYSGTTYYVMGLTTGAIMINQTGPVRAAFEAQAIGFDNLIARYQSEWDYTVNIKGYDYNTSGGANPSSTVLGSTTYWALDRSDIKDSAGVILQIGISSGSQIV